MIFKEGIYTIQGFEETVNISHIPGYLVFDLNHLSKGFSSEGLKPFGFAFGGKIHLSNVVGGYNSNQKYPASISSLDGFHVIIENLESITVTHEDSQITRYFKM